MNAGSALKETSGRKQNERLKRIAEQHFADRDGAVSLRAAVRQGAWSERKNGMDQKKHGISFEFVQTVSGSPPQTFVNQVFQSRLISKP